MNAQELSIAVGNVTVRLDLAIKAIEELGRAHGKTKEHGQDLKASHEKEIALLRQEIDQLKKWQAEVKEQEKEWQRRFWAFGPSLVSALVSGLIAALVAVLLRR